MEPLVLGQWYRATTKVYFNSYIFVCHGRVIDGRYILEQLNNGSFVAVNPWRLDAMNQYTWEPVPVGTLK